MFGSCGFRGKFHPDQLTKVGKKAKVEHFPNSKDLEFQIGTSKGSGGATHKGGAVGTGGPRPPKILKNYFIVFILFTLKKM